MKQENSQLRIDGVLLFLLFLLAIVSCIAIAGTIPSLPEKIANTPFVKQQIMWYAIGSIAIAFAMIIDFDWYQKVSWYLYGVGMIFLFSLYLKIPLLGGIPNLNGAYRWYSIPKLGLFQPSELMKVIMVLVISSVVAKHNEQYPKKAKRDDLWLLGKIFMISVPPLFFIMKQPDLGNTLVICFIVGVITFLSGIRLRYILALLAAAIGFIAFLVYIYFANPTYFTEYILHDYQLDRFYGWLAPEDYPTQGFQLLRGLLATGTGRLAGSGFQSSIVYIPESQTDFIFTVIAHQWGFIGAAAVIVLFLLLIYRILQIAICSNELFGSYLCSGVAALITFQVFQNIGMILGLLPITGITLPFISYGGSSLATIMLAMGFVLNVHSRTKNYMFGSGKY